MSQMWIRKFSSGDCTGRLITSSSTSKNHSLDTLGLLRDAVYCMNTKVFPSVCSKTAADRTCTGCHTSVCHVSLEIPQDHNNLPLNTYVGSSLNRRHFASWKARFVLLSTVPVDLEAIQPINIYLLFSQGRQIASIDFWSDWHARTPTSTVLHGVHQVAVTNPAFYVAQCWDAWEEWNGLIKQIAGHRECFKVPWRSKHLHVQRGQDGSKIDWLGRLSDLLSL